LLARLATLSMPAAEKTKVEDVAIPALAQSYDIWKQTLRPVATSSGLSGSQIREYQALIDTAFAPTANKVRDAVSELAVTANEDMKAEIKASASTTSDSIVRIWLFTGIGAILLFGFGFWISRLVSTSIGRVRGAGRRGSDRHGERAFR
jgi:hypothetical protein